MSEHSMTDIRTGDTVLHQPTGETWVVAWCAGEELAPCGWPLCYAKREHCSLLKKASDEDHRNMVLRVGNCSDSRARKVRALYPEFFDGPLVPPPVCQPANSGPGEQPAPAGAPAGLREAKQTEAQADE